MEKDLVVRCLFNRKTGLPVTSRVPKENDIPIWNEENVIAAFGILNPNNLHSKIAFYNSFEGMMGQALFYTPNLKIASAPMAFRPIDQVPLNFTMGILESLLMKRMQVGNYFLRANVALEMEQDRAIRSVLSIEKSMNLASYLNRATTPIPFDIQIVDEIGAPNPLGETKINARKLRTIITNRFIRSLVGSNPELVQVWMNFVAKGVAWASVSDAPESSEALESLQADLSCQVANHIRQVSESRDLRQHQVLMLKRLPRLVDFWPTLVSQPDSADINLQICGNDNHDPLFVGITGTPICIAEIEGLGDFVFPDTWTGSSPFLANR